MTTVIETIRTGIAYTVTAAVIACPLLATVWWLIIRQIRTHQAHTLEALERDSHDRIMAWPVDGRTWS